MTVTELDTEAALELALYDPDPVTRDQARAYLAQQASPEELGSLIELLDGRQRMTRRRAARILSEVRPDRAEGPLTTALVDATRSPRLRSSAARVLSVLFPEGAPALALGLKDADARVRRACATNATPEAALVDALIDEDPAIAERAGHAVESRGYTVSAERLIAAVAAHAPCPPVLRRLWAAAGAPGVDGGLFNEAKAGDATALDHLKDPEQLTALLGGEHHLSAAWGLAALGLAPVTLAASADPRLRAAAARGLPAGHPALHRLTDDADPGVAWLARNNQQGRFDPATVAKRLGPHAFSDSPSAQPPYGLRPDDVLPEVPRTHAALALCHTRFDVNLGVAVRSAEAAGLREVFLVGREALFRSPARGTDLVLPIRHAPDPAALIRIAREGGYQIVAVQQTPNSVPYHLADYPPRPLFVLGTEDTGLPEALRLAADLAVEIPLFGVVDSLNVAAAATTVMFQWRVHH